MPPEREFQSRLIKDLKRRFPGAVVLPMDGGYIQGFPDVLILFKDKWAALECKRTASARRRPNQEHYVAKLDGMSFARFIFPENREEVLNELEHAFGFDR